MSYYLKNKKYIHFIMIIFCIFSLFFTTKVYALVYVNAEWYDLDNGLKSGSLTGTSNGAIVTINLKHNVSNYDYLAYRFDRYNFTTNPVLINTDVVNYCKTYGEAISTNPVQHKIYTCESTSSTTNYNYDFPSVDYTFSATIVNQNGAGSGCFLSSTFEGYLICPTNRLEGYADHITIMLSYNGYNSSTTLNYALAFSKTVNYLNDDSTEIINALSNLGVIQQNTTTTIQNFNNYVSNSNTSSSINNSSNALTGISSTFNSHLSNMNELTRLVFMPVNFILTIYDNTCQPLTWNIPFVNSTVVVPCMSTIYNGYFSTFISIFSIIVTSLLTYRCCLKLFNTIKGVLDAEDDKIEVIDL